MSEVKDEDQAAAYLKLQDDVKQLILETVEQEIKTNPWGMFASQVRQIAVDVTRNEARTIMDREIQNYRIVYRGTHANY